MSMTLKIPVRQQITLPDAWQECLTPQELSYWLIAKFEQFESAYEVTEKDVTDLKAATAKLQSDVSELQTLTSGQQTAINSLTLASQNLAARCSDIEIDVANNQSSITQLTSDVESIALYKHDIYLRDGTGYSESVKVRFSLFSTVSAPWYQTNSDGNSFQEIFGESYPNGINGSLEAGGVYVNNNVTYIATNVMINNNGTRMTLQGYTLDAPTTTKTAQLITNNMSISDYVSKIL